MPKFRENSRTVMPPSELQLGRYRFTRGSGRRPLVMGVLNLTPDSFSDGGRFHSLDAAISHAEQMIADGVDIIDIGGESSRPGAQPLSTEAELLRIMPRSMHCAIAASRCRSIPASRR